MLADYAFGRLSEDEKTAFEYSMPNFPDIEREMEDVRKVFERVRCTDFEGYYDRQTRNLSVNVLRRLENRVNIRRTLARLIPALGLAAALIAFAVWQKPATSDEIGEGNTRLVASADNYARGSFLIDDEITEAINDFVQHDAAEASVEIKNTAEVLTSVSTSLNESFLEEQISTHFSDSDLNDLLESNDDEIAL